MGDIREFMSGPINAIHKINEVIRAVNSLNNVYGDNFIKINRTSAGLTIGLNWSEVLSRIPSGGGGGGKDIRRAKLTANAGSGNTITANLYNSAGVEQTSGDESGITVYCTIVGGTALNVAVPVIGDNQDIFVVKLPYDNSGTVEQRWYCTTIFQTEPACS